MPSFSTAVPADPRGPAFQIQRTPPVKPGKGIVTSHDLVGCYTHFYRGRTIPCDRPTCQACNDGIPFRWHAYMTVYNPTNQDHFLFEVTAQAAERFTDYRDTYGHLRGCQFIATRVGNKTNGRVMINTQPADLATIVLPDPPNLLAVLAILWDLPLETLTTPTTNPEKRTRRIEKQPPTPKRPFARPRIMGPVEVDPANPNGNQRTP